MFRRIEAPLTAKVAFIFDGQEITAHEGESVAAALLVSGLRSFRTTRVSGKERGPFCMMGACYDCLVEIDGETVQACMTPVSAGLDVRRISGAGND